MTNLDDFIKSISLLADEAPMTAVKLPPNTVGMPEHMFNLKVLLWIICENLDPKYERP